MINEAAEVKKQPKINEVVNTLTDVLDLSHKVLSEMRNKKDDYFGQAPEKLSGVSGIAGSDNGVLEKMLRDLNILKHNLVEISSIINLF
jgi:hypothetical protein